MVTYQNISHRCSPLSLFILSCMTCYPLSGPCTHFSLKDLLFRHVPNWVSIIVYDKTFPGGTQHMSTHLR